MRVFVAGATGVLGRSSVKLLFDAGHEVRGTARGEEKSQLLRSLGAEPVSVDLYDADAVKAAVAGSEAVIHLATKIPAIMKMRSRKAWAENDRLRREGTKNLVDGAIAAGAGTFISESITYIYADGGERWLDENSPTKMAWVALDSTLDLEREAQRFGEGGGKAIILRFGMFYAAYAASTQDSAKMMRRRMFGVIGKGDNYFSSIHVDDAAAAVVAALSAPAGTYNIVEDEPTTQLDYARAFAEEMHLPKPMKFPRWMGKIFLGGPANYILNSTRVSNKKFKEATGWAPKYPSVREGFRQVAGELGAK
jgi:nucleoside-diphosphate-sugar epimerase